MIALASGLRVYLACGVTDMRKGMAGLAMLVQQTLAEDPFGGAVSAFRGRRDAANTFSPATAAIVWSGLGRPPPADFQRSRRASSPIGAPARSSIS